MKVFVLGLDGFPYSFLSSEYIAKVMPLFSGICKKYIAKKINSVYPVVSSVAWTSFATGVNPGEHNIYGFTDRHFNPFEITIVSSADRGKVPIWNTLATTKKKIVINVPITYPPEPINGYMVSCFLCANINKSTYPKEFSSYLKEKKYIIDVDSWMIKSNSIMFLKELIEASKKRFEVAHDLLDEDWDYFQLNIMETDRLLHFFIDYVLDPQYDQTSMLIDEFFRLLDEQISTIIDYIISSSAIIILSDHGFCEIKEEVQLNKWLMENNYLKISDNMKLNDYHPQTICYALTPGRIYFNLKGREEKGTVSVEYLKLRKEIKEKLENWIHPVSGEKIIDNVFFSEEIYAGAHLHNAPDIIVHPRNGYDLKSDVCSKELFTRSHLKGMHTYNDAILLGINIDISKVHNITEMHDIIKDYIENV